MRICIFISGLRGLNMYIIMAGLQIKYGQTFCSLLVAKFMGLSCNLQKQIKIKENNKAMIINLTCSVLCHFRGYQVSVLLYIQTKT